MSSISILNDENSICIGCGLCAAMCPEKNYKMMWNEFGELVPKEVKACTLACGLCENVCPFKNTIHNEDTIGEEQYGSLSGISHSQETGYYLDSIVGYADEFRLTSASGGLATWFLEAALSTGLVDKIIYVTKSENQGKLFDFKVIGSKEDIRAGAGSVYYPVEMSEVISFALNNPGKYAITGLPCFIKAIRLAQKKTINLREESC
jgi:coenzyme F420-reducing hydrogenase beta subunit